MSKTADTINEHFAEFAKTPEFKAIYAAVERIAEKQNKIRIRLQTPACKALFEVYAASNRWMQTARDAVAKINFPKPIAFSLHGMNIVATKESIVIDGKPVKVAPVVSE